MVPYDSAGNYYNDRPTTHCIVCGKKLQLSNEFDKCTDCAVGIINNKIGNINYYNEDNLELCKTPHERLLELGFIIDDETKYIIVYIFNGLEIIIYKEEKSYQTYTYEGIYKPVNLQLAEILVDYLKELENEEFCI